MSRVFAFLLLTMCRVALGCECAFAPLDDETVREAQHVFVFRLLSAEINPEVTWEASGRIEFIEPLSGDGRQFTSIRFSTYSFCCGARLDVGQFYVAFTSGDGPVLEGTVGNLLNMGSSGAEEFREPIRRVMAGSAKLKEVVPEIVLNRLHQVPPPPPPPCPKDPKPRRHGP